MAVYKVIQDIEAEDKLLGPLSLKAFIYAAGAALLAFISIRLAISGTSALVKILFIILFLPPMLLLGVLASPLGRQQPTEVWLLAHIRFMTKPKERRWDQTGIKQLVTITVPKRVEQILTKNFSQTEVNSRLQALANTLDSRGWAVKNAAINAGAQPAYFSQVEAGDDRLSGATTLVQPEPVVDVHPADDIMDEENNPIAQNFQSLMQLAEEERKLALQERLEEAREGAKQQPIAETTASVSTNKDQLTGEEQQLLDRLHQENAEFKVHPPIIRAGATTAPVTGQSQTVKLGLADAGSALSVASISRLANHNSDFESQQPLI